MKSAISPDIWETKRMLITKLYKDEEWPLKQVIKLVQTRDFHPSESQLRSRLKKWHITKPSRKKYDGSRRLSGAKKNQNQNQSQSQNTMAQKPLSDSLSRLPSSSTYHTLHSQPHSQPLAQQLSQRRVDETDSFSEGSRPSVSTVPELSTSPANRYILPSSPHEDANPPFTSTSAMYPSSTIMAPSTPMTPAVYGMDDSKRPANAQSIYFYPPESSPHAFPATAAVSYPTHAYGPYSDPSPLAVVEHPQLDYMGYHAVHPYLAHQKTNQFGVPLSELPPPLLDGSWASHYHDSHAHQPLSPHTYYPNEVGGLQSLAPPAPIYQAGHVM
ncbi:hypothetical protein BDV09DRAFT_144127 [Aspergillus tetrazonus]